RRLRCGAETKQRPEAGGFRAFAFFGAVTCRGRPGRRRGCPPLQPVSSSFGVCPQPFPPGGARGAPKGVLRETGFAGRQGVLLAIRSSVRSSAVRAKTLTRSRSIPPVR